MKLRVNKDEKYYKQTVQVNTTLLIVHVCLLLLFMYLKVMLMVYVNILSVSLYAGMHFAYKKSIDRYVAIVFIEVLIHMPLATICVGWEAGFQLYCFCLVPCIFLCDYLAKADGRNITYQPVLVSGIVATVFLATKVYCVSYDAIYVLEDRIAYILLFFYNTGVSFLFLAMYMLMFEQYILKNEKRLEKMAEADALTKLPNRYLMEDWLLEGYYSCSEDAPMAIAILDVDNFKRLNDVYGHNCGDLVLKVLAEQITSIENKEIYVSRWGGEEFLFMLTGEEAFDKLKEVLEDLRKRIEMRAIVFHNEEIKVTVTIGIAHYENEDSEFNEIIRRADTCLYEGKKNGKNRVVASD